MKKRETPVPRFAAIGGHHSARAATVEWLTPARIIAALTFDWQYPFNRDPCAPIMQPYPTAERTYTILDDGLAQKWDPEERTWCNPPYTDGEVERWLAKMAAHDHGTALIFARTETRAFVKHVWERASGLLFIGGRINFHIGEAFSDVRTRKTYAAGEEAKGNAGAPTVLCAYGQRDLDVLACVAAPVEYDGQTVVWPDGQVPGRFVPLRVPRSVFGAALPFLDRRAGQKNEVTWREEVAAFFERHDGPVDLDDLYRAFAAHPRRGTNRNVEAKLRQQLQAGPYVNVARGVWDRQRELPL